MSLSFEEVVEEQVDLWAEAYHLSHREVLEAMKYVAESNLDEEVNHETR